MAARFSRKRIVNMAATGIFVNSLISKVINYGSKVPDPHLRYANSEVRVYFAFTLVIGSETRQGNRYSIFIPHISRTNPWGVSLQPSLRTAVPTMWFPTVSAASVWQHELNLHRRLDGAIRCFYAAGLSDLCSSELQSILMLARLA